MKKRHIKLSVLLLAALAAFSTYGCDSSEEASSSNDTAVCMGCHDGTTDTGSKILWAKSGWEDSGHAQGQRLPIIDTYATFDGSGTYLGLEENIIGWEWSGSHAFMGNGSSCQYCHEHSGFVNQWTGGYPEPIATGNTAIDGLPEFTTPWEIEGEVILQPAPPGCSTCHAPHKNGNFELTIPNGTVVQTQGLGAYSKSRGNICAGCHKSRVMNGRTNMFTDVNDRLLSSLLTDMTSVSHFGPHYGTQTDVHLGTSAATYAGKTYTNHEHSTSDDANCVTCHMNLRTDMMSHLSSTLGGHSFEVTAPMRGGENANYGGCEGSACHDIIRPADLTAATQAAADGYIRKDMKVFTYTVGGTAHNTMAKMNAIMVKLADPDNGCAGLLNDAFEAATVDASGADIGGSSIKFKNDVYERCHISSYTVATGETIPAVDPATVDVDADPSVRILKALWNFETIAADKSQGQHNPSFVLQLLYDTCEDLHLLTGGANDAAAIDAACNNLSTNRP